MVGVCDKETLRRFHYGFSARAGILRSTVYICVRNAAEVRAVGSADS